MDVEIGEINERLKGDYRLERELGRGGMGIVYLARDEMLDRPVAIKVLPRSLAENSEQRERFLREARTAAQLSHPNVVPIYRADEIGGHAYFVMGYIDGESLAERVQARGPLPLEEGVRYLREVAWALAYAHARGVVHRDVKPENIMIERGSSRACA
jgi:eukaryotic-like serine/threonine-protein kinase